MYVRIEAAIRPEFNDPAADQIHRKIQLAHPDVFRKIGWSRVLDVYWIDIDCPRESVISAVNDIFQDPVMKWLFTGELIPTAAGVSGEISDLLKMAPKPGGKFVGLEKRFRPGVTDNVGRTAHEALEICLNRKLTDTRVSSGKLLLLEGAELSESDLSFIAKDVFTNELIESWHILTSEELKNSGRFRPEWVEREFPNVQLPSQQEVRTFDLVSFSDEELLDLSHQNLWALNLEEMKAIQAYYARPDIQEKRKLYQLGLPTDVELEIIAQSWSEHCKHKLFGASIDYEDCSPHPQKEIPKKVDSLFKETIKGTTRALPREWLLSVFDDNAGIVAFDDEHAICVKAETHNSPSALDPYGGALTGIVGVNRDILGCGRGAKPIFNTNVFCLAAPDYDQTLPDRLLHPRRILAGVRQGVEDGGNQSGIPTVNGALVFDDRYLGKPLVYVGTGGIMPRKTPAKPGSDSLLSCEDKSIRMGDQICMIGGRIGKDGIHGATFSSLALDENSPVTAVQLGDPITQKRMSDFLLEARDLGLYRTLTDNGAGGLSSSVGEMAQITGGARIDVGQAKTKYPGLQPFELVVSESQERMTVAVPPESLGPFLKLAEARNVEASLLGEFTDSGRFEIFYHHKPVANLHLDFLHDGVPQIHLKGRWLGDYVPPHRVVSSFEDQGPLRLLELLSRPNIASKEWLIRQYDHEVQGTSVVKPLHSVSVGTEEARSGPNDGSVIKPKSQSWAGIAIGCGIQPRYSDVDPYLMAQLSVDEAVRNVLSVGAEFGGPEQVLALMDNFCWPDPVGDLEKTAALVRACYGMKEAALALGAPFVSGKDSMKNDFRGKRAGKEIKISVPPTLLISAVGRVPDVRVSKTSDFKYEGDLVYVLGGPSVHSTFSLIGSELNSMLSERLRAKGGGDSQVVLPSVDPTASFVGVPAPHWESARQIYRWIGGTQGKKQFLLRSVHDVSDGGILTAVSESLMARGLGADLLFPSDIDLWEFGFGEGFHSFVVSVSGEAETLGLEDEWRELNVPYFKLGNVTSSGKLKVSWQESGVSKSWSLSVSELEKAWRKEGYWE